MISKELAFQNLTLKALKVRIKKTFIEIKNMNTEKKKRLKKFLIFGGITAIGIAAGVVLYKKNPNFRGIVNTTTNKVKGLVKKEKKCPEYTTIRTPRPVHFDKHGVAFKK